MFDGVFYVQEVPGFDLPHGPLLALWTPVDANGKFFANTGGEVVNYLLSLLDSPLDGFGATPELALTNLQAKIAESYDSDPKLQSVLRRKTDGREETSV